MESTAMSAQRFRGDTSEKENMEVSWVNRNYLGSCEALVFLCYISLRVKLARYIVLSEGGLCPKDTQDTIMGWQYLKIQSLCRVINKTTDKIHWLDR